MPANQSRARRRPPPAAPTPHDTTVGHGEQEPRLYTPAEAAARLRVPESWLRRRAGRRQIPCTFLGKHLRFSAADLAAIIAAAAQVPTGRRTTRRHRRHTGDLPRPGSHASITTPDTNRTETTPWPG
ncbi:helix-turn-helix domain-containing protein [Micromonospora sp. NPDC047644]|uniref:helix-turn-helix domain-containing protein n=1 Tax=Micromonospora sp. NPDC047644 TaxID=3157203 RepID=UPI0034535011